MIYADYTYYTDSYGGRAVNQEDFLRLAAGASAYLDLSLIHISEPTRP